MGKRLGRTYYGIAALALAAGVAATALGDAGAADPVGTEFASGYGAAPGEASAEAGPGGEARAVRTCVEAASSRYEGEVALAQVNRAWQGREGWIVDLSLDVTRADGRTRRRDVGCRQGDHGLQVARY